MPRPLYEPRSGSPLSVDPSVYGPLASETASRTLSAEFIVPIRAISTCPHGDMSVPIWGPNAADKTDPPATRRQDE